MDTARNALLPTRAVARLVPAGLQSQITAVFDAQVACADVQQVHLRCLEQLERCLAPFQGGASRYEPPHIRGAETKHPFDVTAELGGNPGVVHLSNRLEGSFVVAHDLECVIRSCRRPSAMRGSGGLPRL